MKILPNSTLEGFGNLLTVTNLGTVKVTPPSGLFVKGDLRTEGLIQTSIAGPTASQVGGLNVTENANLNGSFEVDLSSDFQPASTNIFRIWQWHKRVGSFQNAQDASRLNAGGGSFLVTYDATGLVLSDYFQDSDGDGIDDAWALAYFHHSPLSEDEKRSDGDADGQTAIQESVAGTNPNDATSVLKAQITSSPDALIVKFASNPGKRYQLGISSDLNNWTPGQFLVATKLSSQFPSITPALDKSFYRIMVAH